SAKQRFSGKYLISGNEILLEFNPVVITHLRNNMDPNISASDYRSVQETVKLSDRSLVINEEGLLSGDGFEYKNYSGAVSGLLNFYEFSGFANVTWRHLMMMIIGLIFIYMGIR